MLLKDVLTKSIQFFKDKKIESARLDAELLISFALKISRIDLYVKYDQPLTEIEIQVCRDFIKRRSMGEPVAYIIQEKGFYGHQFFIQPGVLIPRPETEELVEYVLAYIKKNNIQNPKILDIGSGSGCIGLSVLASHNQAQLISIDISDIAIQTTLRNAEKLNVADRMKIIQEDFQNTDLNQFEKFDCIVGNPPYIDINDTEVEKNVKNFEPHQALFAEENGLAFLKNWSKITAKHLNPSGLMMFEMGYKQGIIMKNFLETLNCFSEIEIIQDLSKKDRFIKGIYHG